MNKVESSVIAYFSVNDEDFLIAFQPVSTDIILNRNVWYWVVAIFFVIFIILVYGTTLVYKEVKKSENEELDIQQDDNTQNDCNY